MWFSRRYWRVGVLDQCFWWKKTTICCSCCWKCLCIWFSSSTLMLRWIAVLHVGTLQRISANLGQSILNLVSIWLWISNLFISLLRVVSFSARRKSFLCFEMNTGFSAIPHYCAEYFWLRAAKVWTQPFIILSQGKQLASLSKQNPRDADWCTLSSGLLAESRCL